MTLEILEETAFAEDHADIRAFASLELMAIDFAVKSMVVLSPNAAARATGSKFARCLRMISSVLSTSASPMLIEGRVIAVLLRSPTAISG